jgi:hypothetical protein
MNKKTYIAPTARAIALYTEGALLKGSDLKIDRDADAKTEQLTGRYGWDSSNWTDSEE